MDWLTQTIEDEQIDTLLIAGDIFDTSTPSNRAQELYYQFLCRVVASCCRHVVIIAGNHDSPSFLNAPKEILRTMHVHVVGSMTDALHDEVIVLTRDSQITQMDADNTDAIICAVPYLRDKDIRTIEPGETIDDKNRKLVEGIKVHYAEVVKIAEQKREEILQTSSIKNPKSHIPIIAMGHLFTAGGKTVEGDGVRDLYVGSLVHVTADAFPASIDYLALGHLHVPQTVGRVEHIRYCGSPIPMGFGEATQEKKVVLIEFRDREHTVHEIPVPCFQQLVRIVGSLDDIRTALEKLKTEKSTAWLEIEYNGSDSIATLQAMLDEAISTSSMEIRRVKNMRVMDRVASIVAEDETLDDLDVGDVFVRCLDAAKIPDEDREELLASYNEIIKDLREDDVHAE